MKNLIVLICLFISLGVNAQTAQSVQEKKDIGQKTEQIEMADNFRADGKIYVVVAVLATILAGIVIYLIMLDKKISKLENQNGI